MEVPAAVKAIIEALTDRAVARCLREGIALEDFLAAVLAEQAGGPPCPVAELFGRAFRRLAGDAN